MSFIDLTDSLDHLIVMHRDAHFGGLFEEMLSYYQNEDHIGIHDDFDIERIRELNYYEKKTETNLSDTLLTEEEKAKVEDSKKAYRDLKQIYEYEKSSSFPTRLIADLILSEEAEPNEILEKIIASQKAMIPDLVRLLQWDEGYDPLFPGYGFAPCFALQAFCQIKDPSVIIPLFETLKRESFIGDDLILSALSHQGDEAKRFLLKRMKSFPITADNTHAAFALSAFMPDDEIALSALELLKNPKIWKETLLCSYLLSLCEEKSQDLKELCNNALLPQSLKKEIEQSIKK